MKNISPKIERINTKRLKVKHVRTSNPLMFLINFIRLCPLYRSTENTKSYGSNKPLSYADIWRRLRKRAGKSLYVPNSEGTRRKRPLKGSAWALFFVKDVNQLRFKQNLSPMQALFLRWRYRFFPIAAVPLDVEEQNGKHLFELGIIVDHAVQGQGFGREILQGVYDQANEHNIPIASYISVKNKASQHLHDIVGFEKNDESPPLRIPGYPEEHEIWWALGEDHAAYVKSEGHN